MPHRTVKRQLHFSKTSVRCSHNGALTELKPARTVDEPNCAAEAACCLGCTAWPSVLVVSQPAWPVLTQARGPGGSNGPAAIQSPGFGLLRRWTLPTPVKTTGFGGGLYRPNAVQN